ncbi:MAG: hypothetical protein HYU64_04615, partial [Armatimonadetes bacterium]|nr:hypothetical protein [Armatimonadota bacterium]
PTAAKESANPHGMADYKKAIDAVQAEQYEEAQALLEKAVSQNSEFTEAWYNLGATRGVLAVIAAHENNDSAALHYFREAVAAKRRAKDLMDQGKFVFYNKSQQDEVRSDVEHALEDADEVMGDERSLLIALRITPIPRH